MLRVVRVIVPILLVGLVVFLGARRHSLSKAEQGVYTGTIEARQSRIGSTVGGRVSETLAREGDTVRKGRLLVLFESDELNAGLEAALAAERQASDRVSDLEAGARPSEIARAEAAVAQARSQLLKLQNGTRPEEIASARAGAEQARERLALVKRGARQEDIERAQALLDAAKADRVLADQSRARIERLFKEGAVSAQTADEAKARAEVAGASETAAKRQLDELKAGNRPEEIRAAEQAYSQARAGFELVKRGPRREDIEAARHALEQAEASLSELRAGARPYQIAQAKSAFEQARASVAQVRAKVKERAVFAPKSGQLQVLNVQPGDIVAAGQTVGSILDPNDLYLKVYVPANQLAGLTVGTKLAVTADSGVRVTGVVEQIPVEAEFTPRNVQTKEERGLQFYAIKIRLPNPDLKLRAGMSADVRLKG